jgi:hypothetical protein
MIVHCSQKLARRLTGVSSTPLAETSPLGSWHAHLYHVDRRQSVLFCHDATRFVLFVAGLRKEQFVEFGRVFRESYTTTLAALGFGDNQMRKVELALGPVEFDIATNRSVQGSMRQVQLDIAYRVVEAPNVLALDPIALACELNHRPTSIYGDWLWPDKRMRALVESL